MSKSSTRTPRSGTARDVARSVKARPRIEVAGGTALTLLVLACHAEDTTGVDLASGALVRVRVAWAADHGPDQHADISRHGAEPHRAHQIGRTNHVI